MPPWRAGGFEHNLQSLRVVDELEQRYAAFDGLNLSFETREGILKRCQPELAQALGEVAGRFLRGGPPVWRRRSPTSPMKSPTATTMSTTA